MYIRAKLINGKYYYYLVESERMGGRIVQKTRAYLGSEEEAKSYAKKEGLKIVEPKPGPKSKSATKLDGFIAAKKKRLDSLRISPDVEKKYREDLSVYWTYHSTSIEGSTLSLRETNLFLSEGVVGANKPFEDYMDAKGHKEAIELIFLWMDKEPDRKIHEMDILNLHGTTMFGRQWAGNYRSVQVYIRGAGHMPPPPSKIKEMMRDFIERLNKNSEKLHPIDHAAATHSDFEAIHPFVDGNGRVGRLLANWMLMRVGYPPIIIEVKERKKYFRLLEEAQVKGNPAPLVWFFKSKLNQAYDFYLKRADPDYEKWIKTMKIS
ncbi:MAG TPA: Fic family protein [Candidatus Micrarchaeota archaeon]|nr:Fic family protein [Candidatus Micrarchaeota archaeon]